MINFYIVAVLFYFFYFKMAIKDFAKAFFVLKEVYFYSIINVNTSVNFF
jgi:hypothetical protein